MYPRTQQSFSNVTIEVEVSVEVAIDAPQSSCRAFIIGIYFHLDFRACAHVLMKSSRVQLSELTGVLLGSLLKRESSNTCAQ